MTWLTVLSFLRRVPNVVWLALALIAGAGYYGHWSFNRGVLSERTAQLAARAKELAAEIERANKDEASAGLAKAELDDYVSRELPAIEAGTHDAITTIRTIYKDRPVPVGCERPEPVRLSIQDRIDQANRAAR